MSEGHSRLSPSKRSRWGACPGSIREEAKYAGSGKSSPSALDGTRTHMVLEFCIKSGQSASALIGMNIADKEGGFTVDEERAERVDFAMSYINSRRDELAVSSQFIKVIAESRVDPAPFFNRNDLSGTVDVQIITDKVLEIIDYKDGVQEVTAHQNQQLDQYAWGVLAECRDLRFDHIRMTIIQPKLRQFGKKGVSYYEVSREVFEQGLITLSDQAAATDDPNAPLVSGEHCQWCPHAGNCQERSSNLLKKAGIKFGPTTVLEQACELSTDLSTEQMREVIEALPLIRGWLDSVEEAALERLKKGDVIEGLKVVRGRGMRSWAFPDEEIAVKLNKMTVPKAVIWETKLISPATAEKLKWKSGDKQKQLSPKQLKVLHEELIRKGDGALKVVSAADERAAVVFQKVEQMFGPADDALPSWLS